MVAPEGIWKAAGRCRGMEAGVSRVRPVWSVERRAWAAGGSGRRLSRPRYSRRRLMRMMSGRSGFLRGRRSLLAGRHASWGGRAAGVLLPVPVSVPARVPAGLGESRRSITGGATGTQALRSAAGAERGKGEEEEAEGQNECANRAGSEVGVGAWLLDCDGRGRGLGPFPFQNSTPRDSPGPPVEERV